MTFLFIIIIEEDWSYLEQEGGGGGGYRKQPLWIEDGIYVAVNFCFSFVSNSLAYITIPQNKGRKLLIVSLVNVFFPVSVVSMSQGKLSVMFNISCRRNGQIVLLPWILHRLINLSWILCFVQTSKENKNYERYWLVWPAKIFTVEPWLSGPCLSGFLDYLDSLFLWSQFGLEYL